VDVPMALRQLHRSGKNALECPNSWNQTSLEARRYALARSGMSMVTFTSRMSPKIVPPKELFLRF
jgi:hypothetical protein